MSETVSVEALKEHFPPQNVEPYGSVLIIPNRMFKRGWELDLEAQGHRVFATSYNGESSFLVRLDKGEPRNVESKHEKVPTPPANSPNVTSITNSSKAKDKAEWKRWTEQEERKLLEMVEAGHDFNKIGVALDRSGKAVKRKLVRMKGEHLKPVEIEPVATVSGDLNPVASDEDHIKELLAAASELYPRFRHACQILLSEATTKIMNQEKNHVP